MVIDAAYTSLGASVTLIFAHGSCRTLPAALRMLKSTRPVPSGMSAVSSAVYARSIVAPASSPVKLRSTPLKSTSSVQPPYS